MIKACNRAATRPELADPGRTGSPGKNVRKHRGSIAETNLRKVPQIHLRKVPKTDLRKVPKIDLRRMPKIDRDGNPYPSLAAAGGLISVAAAGESPPWTNSGPATE